MTDAPVISVRGEAVLEVEPEIAHVTVRVQAQDADRRAALDALAARNGRALELVRSYGEAVERAETGGLWVTPLVRHGRREGGVRAYQGTAWIELAVTDFTVLGELVARLGDLERTAVHGPRWALRPGSEVHARAARQAVQEAVARARGYADALGCTLTGLIELSDEGLASPPQPYMETFATRAAPGAAPGGEPEPIEIAPEAQTVRAAVTARFTATAPDLGA
ncbi:SIMPL domain-containing protein [Actinomadura parmotrematis]|uniref:SIMPL domain-containing protein n=1 Tax=Actinomadura parmotrematis TaxID=2864039 RepID=A0ABS7FUE9_9ACTN|nr:SIMPL domain-containing protein [Actinomadura parmotrematis]MBW8483820.1 SIMPL domain-containing protein [Actinomadura parmotrematis]